MTIIIVKWIDNKTVLLGSTLYGVEPIESVKRWYFPIFTYLLDVCVVNAWLLYRADCEALNKKHDPLKKFRLGIAKALSTCGKGARKGRPNIEKSAKNKTSRS